jgi:hypothetical protein
MAKPREDGGETHRWAVDRVEEGTAAVEQDGDHMYELPRWLIPANARDGDVLVAAVTSRGDGELSISVKLDPAGRAAAKGPKRAKGARSAKDPGGDVVL